MKLKKHIRHFFVTGGVLFVGFCIYFLAYNTSTTPRMWDVCQKTRVFRKNNIKHLETIYTKLFDRAKDCGHDVACEERVGQDILDFFVETEKVPQFPSTYFIKLNNDEVIEKLFLHGRYETTRMTTDAEKKVLAVLKGERKEICTEGWTLENEVGTNMTYLHDISAEAEAIIPVDVNGVRLGAIVKGFGD